MASTEYWCFGKTALPACVREIIRVNREIKNRDEMLKRTGRDTNRGLSLMGCYNHCVLDTSNGTRRRSARRASRRSGGSHASIPA
jgi:hypothetical protein